MQEKVELVKSGGEGTQQKCCKGHIGTTWLVLRVADGKSRPVLHQWPSCRFCPKKNSHLPATAQEAYELYLAKIRGKASVVSVYTPPA